MQYILDHSYFPVHTCQTPMRAQTWLLDAVRFAPIKLAGTCAAALLDLDWMATSIHAQVRKYCLSACLQVYWNLVNTWYMLMCNILFCTPYIHAHSTLSFIDIDECFEESDECNQACTNSVGSYICSCNSGYQLAANQKTCVGKSIIILHDKQTIAKPFFTLSSTHRHKWVCCW